MAHLYKKINASTGSEVLSRYLYEEAAFIVSNPAGVTEISVSGYLTLSADANIELSRNGQELFEDGSLDYTRDVANNKVVFNYTIPQNSKVRIRVYI